MVKQKLKILIIISAGLFIPAAAWAVNLDSIKADFLQGNYRRVILEGIAQSGHFNIQGADELNYLVGLSYLKEDRIEQAQDYFRRVLNNPISQLKEEAALASGDACLIKGQYHEAEAIYNSLLENNPNTALKAAILYRLSQSGYRKGDKELANEYLLRLRRDFPLSLELRYGKGIPRRVSSPNEYGDFSVQVGFFTKNLNAVNFRNKLLSMGYPAFVEESREGCRVKVGRFRTQAEAMETENKLSRDGFPTKLCP